MKIGASLVLIAIGAILTWAVSATVSGVNITMIGVILMVIGAAGLIISLIMVGSRRRTDVVHRSVDGTGAPMEQRTTYVTPQVPEDQP